MITALELENFKCFSRLRLSMGPLTLLTGYNAGGKSSAIQPLLLLAQAARSGGNPDSIALNGPMIRLGTVGDLVPANVSPSSVAFKVESEAFSLSCNLKGRAGERHFEVEHSVSPAADNSGADVDLDRKAEQDLRRVIGRLSYLSAVRTSPEDSYPTPELHWGSEIDVGIDGRFAAYWHDRLADSVVPRARCYPNESADSFRKQFDAWFSTLFPNGQATAQHYPTLSAQSLQFRISEFGVWRRPANVGYGFSYAFPVLVALLGAAERQVVIIDSPEAHLHPLAQSRMGRLIAHMAAAGVQVIVETHSDHLLNGIRLALKEGPLKASEFKVHFFSGVSDSGNGVLSLRVDGDGRIHRWPEGFFDQSEKDMARLSGWE
jgi:CRISPR-associated Cas5-like protein